GTRLPERGCSEREQRGGDDHRRATYPYGIASVAMASSSPDSSSSSRPCVSGNSVANITMAMIGPMPRSVAVVDWLNTASSGAASARLPDRPSTPARFAQELAELRNAVGNSSEV